MKNVLLFSLLLWINSTLFAQCSISINAPQSFFDTSITAITIADVRGLLQEACNCEVTLDNPSATVQIFLPEAQQATAEQPTTFSSAAKFPYLHYPRHDYAWKQEKRGNKFLLSLSADSWQGISFGLYGLLQEKLGFKFYHPHNTFVPHFKQWPLTENFTWESKALFDKNGFHLHTQHPLELTEQLHDGTLPNALNEVKEYINWLTRNGQNYFEFCLLNSIDKRVWIDHAKNITDYVHQRGLLTGVDISLHMIQQKTFQLYTSPINKQKQIAANLVWLNKANWDIINMEFSTAEFISGNKRKKEEQRQFVLQWLKDNSHTKLMGRQHVVQHKTKTAKAKNEFVWDSISTALDKERGVMAHTVMFYDMSEPRAPVYENENQQHMYRFLLAEQQKRETWYYPESSYWITFDVSVPMLLLPYLKARLTDIDSCAAHHIPGHLTFSSGWEWGYWLVDWSIARWSWQHTFNGEKQYRFPEMYAQELLQIKQHKSFTNMLNLQQEYLKDSSLMQWMTAMTITDEISIKALANEYHPRPKWPYKYIRNKATLSELNEIQNKYLFRLDSFAHKALKLSRAMRMLSEEKDSVSNELIDGLEITAYRAFHRTTILRYLIALNSAKTKTQRKAAQHFLADAVTIRHRAQAIVTAREAHYRYSTNHIARKRWDHTAYHFGYLYPASQLHFWNREEQQAKRNRYSAFFMNIWNVGRIVGLIK